MAEAPVRRSGLRLRAPRHRVAPRARWWWATQVLVVVVPPALVLAMLAALLPTAATWLLVGLAVVAVPGSAAAVAVPLLRFRVHRWEVTDDVVITRSGWLWREWRVAPLSRAQTVDTARGPLEQVFRLSTLTVTTASAKGPLRVSGLDREVADDLAERLTEATQATRGDAT